MIELRGIGKKFESYSNPSERFKEFFFKRNSKGYWGLQDINLSVKKGQTVGLLGPNGSGKSTLLQIIAGILHPTTGSMDVVGRISALLELGAGFNPDFTGEENVYLNASILGMTRQEISQKFNSIVEFSGIGDFIHQPVKTYSSGMFVRLAFSTAINVDPDIIIIDEALAVGDAAFQQKCIGKLKQLQKEGKTILFVSHDTSAVKSLCDYAVLMQHGRILDEGSPDLMVNKYLKIVYSDTLGGTQEINTEPQTPEVEEDMSPIENGPNGDNRFGNGDAEIIGIALCDSKGVPTQALNGNTPIHVKISVKYHKKLESPIIGFVLRDRIGNDITSCNTLLEGYKLPESTEGAIHTVIFELQSPHLLKGNYSLSPAIANGTLSNHEMCDWIDNAYIFESINEEIVYGMMRFSVNIKINSKDG